MERNNKGRVETEVEKPWNPLDQEPYQTIMSDQKLIPSGLFKDTQNGPRLLLWELADLGKVKKLENPPEKVPEETIQTEIQGWVGRKNDVMKLMKDPKMSETYPLLQKLAARLNNFPFGWGYLYQIKKSGYLLRGFELRKSTQESHVVKYQAVVERFSNLKMEGLSEIVPDAFTADRVEEIVPQKSSTAKWYKRLRATRDMENE